jgi:hypothetical protein
VRWLEETDDGLTVPEFDEHNGTSAKRRATETKRKQADRASDPEAHGSWTPIRKESAPKAGQVSASDADKLRTREELDKKKTSSSIARGARLAPDWSPDPEGIAFAEQQGLRNGRAQAELERFRDYWTAQPGQKGVKADWPATWRNWCRKAAENPAKAGAVDIFAGAV